MNALLGLSLESIYAQLIGHVGEVQAPGNLLNCLRLSRAIVDPKGLLSRDRVKFSAAVWFNLPNHYIALQCFSCELTSWFLVY